MCGDSSACVLLLGGRRREREGQRESIVFWGRGKKRVQRKKEKRSEDKREVWRIERGGRRFQVLNARGGLKRLGVEVLIRATLVAALWPSLLCLSGLCVLLLSPAALFPRGKKKKRKTPSARRDKRKKRHKKRERFIFDFYFLSSEEERRERRAFLLSPLPLSDLVL